MPEGQHYGRTQAKAYTAGYHRIYANIFKNLVTASLGNYMLSSDSLKSFIRQKLYQATHDNLIIFNLRGQVR
jgi:hypothetical protein